MNLFSTINNFFTKKRDELFIRNATKNVLVNVNDIKNIFKRVKHKGLDYGGSYSNRGAEFKPPEYDLNQIAAIIDVDSYLRRAIEKYVELMLKNGFDFIGKNNSTVKYIKKRFEQIAQVTSIPTKQLLEDICQQLVAYSNVFISKVRNENASGGKIRKTFWGKELKPVAGYFVEDATSIRIAKNINGKILGYKQYIPNAFKAPVWLSDNMIHMYHSRKRGLSFGTPLCYPVIDDIKALRKIEQNLEILSHQHTIPIIHYKIGNKERPGQPEEVTAVKYELETNPPYGCMVTTDRHEIKDIGVNTNAADADKLANVFKMRIYAGLGISPLIMGEGAGAGRQTAESLDRQMENTAEKYMQVVKTFFDEFIIKELLLEGGYKYDAYNFTNKVELYFPPINLEAKHKSEEHLNNMYQGNLVTESEARIKMGYEPLSEKERKDLHLHHIQIPLAIISAVDEQYQETTTKSSTGKVVKVKKPVNTNNPRQKSANKIANVAQPTNQHGKSLARPKIPKDAALKNKLMIHYKATINDIIMSLEDNTFNYGIKPIIKVSKDLIKNNFNDYLRTNYVNGYRSIKNDGLINFDNNIRDSIKQEEIQVNQCFNILENRINKFITNPNKDKIKNISIVQSVFNNYKDKFEKIIENELLKSYNLGILQAGLDSGKTNYYINSDYCNCGHKSKEINLDFINHSKIPPLYKNCKCILEIKE